MTTGGLASRLTSTRCADVAALPAVPVALHRAVLWHHVAVHFDFGTHEHHVAVRFDFLEPRHHVAIRLAILAVDHGGTSSRLLTRRTPRDGIAVSLDSESRLCRCGVAALDALAPRLRRSAVGAGSPLCPRLGRPPVATRRTRGPVGPRWAFLHGRRRRAGLLDCGCSGTRLTLCCRLATLLPVIATAFAPLTTTLATSATFRTLFAAARLGDTGCRGGGGHVEVLDDHLRQRILQQPLEVGEQRALLGGDEGHGDPGGTGTTGTTDAVHVILRDVGQLEIDDEG